ncbi:MAG: hypothetical protein EB164_09680, partial [Thaumarchaeota archaeon]|nr:hypothetical protein [Nitrososphaerota archaeon]
KLREEERKQQSEDIAYNQKVRDKILSIEDKSRQLNYDKMKKEGATESDILNQKFEELTNESERLYNEYFNAREQALADPLNKEKRENALNLFGSAFEKTIDAQKTMLGASGSFGGFIASDMAKKGLGGGVTGLGVPTMVDLNKKQVEKLTGIIAVLNEIKNRNLLNVPVATVSPDTPTSQTP